MPDPQSSRIGSALRRYPDVTALLLLLAVYVAAALTPSSYGRALQMVGASETGILLGSPQDLRSDEWAVWTPLLQGAVNNHFERYNVTSPYGEDLRNFNALPLHDWALPFKPQYWGFLVLPPAWAFSLYFAFQVLAFYVGWRMLFQRLGYSPLLSGLASGLLFFSAYVQFWWTTVGPLISFFPWLPLAWFTLKPAWAKGLGLFYAGTVFLLSQLYPPLIIPLVFVAALLVLGWRRDLLTLPNIAAAAAGGLAAVAVTAIYLWEPIRVMAATVYPGARSVGGGTLVHDLFFTQFFPLLSSDGRRNLVGSNLLEVSAAGSFLTVFVLCFLDWRRLRWRLATGASAARLIAVLGGLAALTAWMLLPIPAWAGKILLWDKVLPERMVFPYGVLLLVLSLELERLGGLCLAAGRLVLVMLVVGAAAALGPLGVPGPWHAIDVEDVAVLPLLAAAIALALWRRWPAAPVLVGVAALANAAAFGWYNPVQSAHAIFTRPDVPLLREFDARAAAHEKGWLVAGGLPGGLLNGWGYKSLAHVLIAPQLGFFRPLFPELDDAEFNRIFNRYAHVQLQNVAEPLVPQPDVIHLPIARFEPGAPPAVPPVLPPVLPTPPAAAVVEAVPGGLPRGGYVDSVTVDGDRLKIIGWALVGPDGEGRELRFVPGVGASVERIDLMPRPDVDAALAGTGKRHIGFRAVLKAERPVAAQGLTLCVIAADARQGEALLNDAPGGPACGR